MSKPAVASGDVVLIRARVRSVYPDRGIATVRYATPGSAGGPGFAQEVVPIGAIAQVVADECPDDDDMVPRRIW